MNGFITIHRQIQEKGYYQDSHYVHLWVHLLLKANHKDKEFLFNGEIQKCKRGQMITGILKLSRETGINKSKVERILKLFESENQIERQRTNKFSLITIKNYDLFQTNEIQSEKPVRIKREASEKPVRTNNNDNNVNNETRKESSKTFAPPTLSQLQEFMKENFYIDFSNSFFSFYESKGWMVGKNKMKDWKQAVRGWVARDQKLKDFNWDQFQTDKEKINHTIKNPSLIESLRKHAKRLAQAVEILQN